MSAYSSSNLDDPSPDYTAYNPKRGVAWAPRRVHVYEDDPEDQQRALRRPLRRRSSALSLTGSLSSVFGSLTNLLTPKLGRKSSSAVVTPAAADDKAGSVKPVIKSKHSNPRLRSAGSLNDLTLIYQQQHQHHQQQPQQQRQQQQKQHQTPPQRQCFSQIPSFRRDRNCEGSLGGRTSPTNVRSASFRLGGSRESLPSDNSDGAKSLVGSPDGGSSSSTMEGWDADLSPGSRVGHHTIHLEAPCFTDQEHDRTAATLQALVAEDVSYLAIDRRYLRTGRLVVNEQSRAVCCGSLRTKSRSYPSRIRAVTIHIHKGMDQKDSQIKLVRNVASLRRLRHRHVADVLGLCIEGSPHTPGGTEVLVMTERTHFHLTLRRLVLWAEENNPQLLTAQIISTFGIQICYGLRYLEKHKILHTNLTTTSVLLDSKCVCKLYNIDFQAVENRSLNTRWLPLETFLQSLFTFKSVVWCFGVVLWEMASLCCEQPYPHLTTINDIILYLAHGKRLIRPQTCPKKLYRLMCLCWTEKPRSRPSWDDLIVTLTSYRQSLQPTRTPDEVFPDRDDFWEDNSWMDELDGVYDITLM